MICAEVEVAIKKSIGDSEGNTSIVTGCRWMLRSAWMCQELLTTFKEELHSVTLVPIALYSGIFVSSIFPSIFETFYFHEIALHGNETDDHARLNLYVTKF